MVLRAAGAAEQVDGQLVENGADSRQEQVQHDVSSFRFLGKSRLIFWFQTLSPVLSFRNKNIRRTRKRKKTLGPADVYLNNILFWNTRITSNKPIRPQTGRKGVNDMYHYNDFNELDEREPISEYLTPREVMDLLYIGKNTLYKLLNSGELKGFRIGKQWRVERNELQKYASR